MTYDRPFSRGPSMGAATTGRRASSSTAAVHMCRSGQTDPFDFARGGRGAETLASQALASAGTRLIPSAIVLLALSGH